MNIKQMIAGTVATNCYICWDEASKDAFIIDPASDASTLLAAVRAEGLDIKYILLTHGHGDHIGAVSDFKSAFPEATIAAGKNELELLADARKNFSEEINGRPSTVTPDLALADGDELMLGPIHMKIIETPGHTEGGISILVNGDTLFSGDTLFQASIGRTDLVGGDYETLIASIREKLFTLPDEIKVYPGHMGSTSIGYEKAHNPFV